MLDEDDRIEEICRRIAEDPAAEPIAEAIEVLESTEPSNRGELVSTFVSTVAGHEDAARLSADRLAERLESGDRAAREAASHALANLAAARPSAVARVAEDVLGESADEFRLVERNVAYAIALTAAERPGEIAPLAGEIRRWFDAGSSTLANAATDVASAIAAEDPAALSELVPTMIRQLTPSSDEWDDAPSPGLAGVDQPAGKRVAWEEQQAQREQSAARSRILARALADVADGAPEVLAAHVPLVCDSLPASDAGVRTSLLDALAAVAEAHPEETIDAIDPVSDVLAETESPAVRERAARVLSFTADVAGRRVADAVLPAVGDLFDLLDDDDPTVRGNAAGLLSYVAEYHPEEVAPARSRLHALLEDDAATVRGCAAWTLAYAGSDESRERLAATANDDPDERIRRTANHALEVLDGEHDETE